MKNDIINENSFSGWDSDKNGKRWEDYDTIVCPDGQVIDMIKLLDDQHRAQAALVHINPTLGGFVGKLRQIYTFRVSTQATDGYNIFINPQFTYNLTLTEKCFVLAHEIMHCLLNHMRRGKGHDPKKSNIAADYECNITLVEMGMFNFDTIKNLGAYIDRKYANMGYEAIYNDCTSSAKDSMSNQKQQTQAQQNQQKNNSNSSNNQQQSGNSSKQSNSNNRGNQGGGSGQNQQPKSEAYKRGWKKAIEDYKKGKLNI